MRTKESLVNVVACECYCVVEQIRRCVINSQLDDMMNRKYCYIYDLVRGQ